MKDWAEKILQLCKSNVLDRGKYIEILEFADKPEIPERSPFADSLQEVINNDSLYYSIFRNNPVVRLYFGEIYVKRNLVKRIENMGIGTVKNFCIKGGMFNISLSIGPKLSQKSIETRGEFEKRLKDYYSCCPYKLVSRNSVTSFADTDRNKSMLLETIRSFMDIHSYQFETWGDHIRCMNVTTKHIVPYIEDKEDDPVFCLASLERIAADCRFSGENPASSYYGICGELGYTDDFCAEYKKRCLATDGIDITSKAVSFGRNVPQYEMLLTANKVFLRMSGKMAHDACMLVYEESWDMGYHFKSHISPEDCVLYDSFPGTDEEFLETGFLFDRFVPNKYLFAYEIPSEFSGSVKDMLEREYGVKEIKISLQQCNSTFCIHGIDGYIDNLLLLSDR